MSMLTVVCINMLCVKCMNMYNKYKLENYLERGNNDLRLICGGVKFLVYQNRVSRDYFRNDNTRLKI